MDEKDLSKRIIDLDFSRYSAKHKEQLWNMLNKKSGRRVLLEHELEHELENEALENVAGGLDVPLPYNCFKCGSQYVKNKCPKGCR